MPQKPSKNMTATVSWEEYKVLKDKAIREDTNIKKIINKLVRDHLEGEGDEESGSTKIVYACPECEKEFDEKNQLRGHMRGKHETGLTNEDIEELRKDLENV